MLMFPRYEIYKDSGISWIGQIPNHWECISVKHLAGRYPAVVQTGPFGAQLHAHDYVENGVPLILIRNVNNLRIDDSDIPRILDKKAEQLSLYRLEIGDIVFSRVGSIGRIALVTERERGWLISGQMLRLRIPNPALYDRYAMYFFSCNIVTEYVSLVSIGSTRDSINTDILRNVPVPIPPLDEQTRIAAFLDEKTAEIDDAIAKKQRLIELLQEQKAILINRAVTQGLDPNVPLRDSGVAWIRQIPAHWEVKRAKFLFNEINERSETGTEELLSVSHMTGVTPRSEKNVNMFMAEDYTGSKLCRKDDLVFNIMWAWMGALGVSDRTGIVSSSYGVYRQKQAGIFNSWYLEHLLRSTEYVAEYNRRSTGLHSSRLRLYPDMFFDMELSVPPRQEQDRIETVTIERTALADQAIQAVEREIEKLNELRSILISEAVTGKIKV